jgi:hypothetical protein
MAVKMRVTSVIGRNGVRHERKGCLSILGATRDYQKAHEAEEDKR